MHRITRERGWALATWRRLPRRDKVQLLAYDRWRGEQRREMRKALSKDDWGVGVESVLLALAEL